MITNIIVTISTMIIIRTLFFFTNLIVTKNSNRMGLKNMGDLPNDDRTYFITSEYKGNISKDIASLFLLNVV